MMPFKVGDRIGSKYNALKGTVVKTDGILCTVKWDGGTQTENYHRVLRLLNPTEDGANAGTSVVTINEEAHGHE